MEASDFFLKLLVIIIAVKFFSEVLTYLNLSSLLWEAIAGIIVTQRFSYSRNFEQFCKV